METLVFEVTDKKKAKALKAVAKALGVPEKSQKNGVQKGSSKKETESPYNPEFVEMVERGRQQIREGKTVTVKLEDLWK